MGKKSFILIHCIPVTVSVLLLWYFEMGLNVHHIMVLQIYHWNCIMNFRKKICNNFCKFKDCKFKEVLCLGIKWWGRYCFRVVCLPTDFNLVIFLAVQGKAYLLGMYKSWVFSWHHLRRTWYYVSDIHALWAHNFKICNVKCFISTGSRSK